MLPKLMAAVDTWDPRTEPVPIHTWIHPWLTLMRVRFCLHHSTTQPKAHLLRAQDRLVPLYAPIRHKLSSALGAWHPGDGSALALLSPWRMVFTETDWEALLSRCILPKLGWVLSQLVINPADQQLEPVQWTLAWAAAIPARHMATLLEQVRLDCAYDTEESSALTVLRLPSRRTFFQSGMLCYMPGCLLPPTSTRSRAGTWVGRAYFPKRRARCSTRPRVRRLASQNRLRAAGDVA